MYILIEIANVVLGIVIISIYLKGLYQNYEKKLPVILALYAVAGIGLSVLSVMPINPFIRLGFTCISILLLAKYLFGAKWLTSLYSALLFSAIAIIVENICSGLIIAFGVSSNEIYKYGNYRVIYLVFSELVELFAVYLVVRLSQWKKTNESLFSAVPLLLCQIFSIFICYVMYLGALKTATQITVSFIIGALGILYINIVIFLYVERIKKVSEIKKQNELAEQQYESKLEYFEQVKEDQAETRALWHDIKKYLNTMTELINMNDTVHARECIDQVTELFAEIGNVVDVGNTVISAVLNHSVQKARRLGVDTDLDVRVQPDLNIPAADLSVIIGNTFDNAIEACGRLESAGKKITVQLIEKNSILFYEITNPYDPRLPAEKKDPKRHGFGLKNVKRCLDKYKGTMYTESDGAMYRVSININIPGEHSGPLAS
ncbi:GHKL domain-containing protein [Sporobacter termitidis DSM 10068]|uniref:GHKL domain-containing protein n=1 Tax=Sporobacter termitidis DSM 10068 TaxID=1123282 RepID=A0A1M5ZDF0_9FIRM|nr:sensor histidine kinase [Sporobacter termitidis]SHI22228.1 GHKL domain-containing protein [Sporobacter termitidis DSM 10068]